MCRPVNNFCRLVSSIFNNWAIFNDVFFNILAWQPRYKTSYIHKLFLKIFEVVK